MRKKTTWGLIFVFGLLLAGSPSAEPQEAGSARPMQSKTSSPARNEELLEIWKEHVKTLTEERDKAYKELEALKRAKVAAPAPIASKTSTVSSGLVSATDLEGYKASIRELRVKVSDLEASNEKMNRDLLEARNDKEALISSKQALIAEADRWKAQVQRLKTAASPDSRLDAPAPGSSVAITDLQSRLDEAREKNQSLNAQIASLKAALATKPLSQSVENKMESANQAQLEKLTRENEELRKEMTAARSKLMAVQSENNQLLMKRSVATSASADTAQALKRAQDEVVMIRAERDRLQKRLEAAESGIDAKAAQEKIDQMRRQLDSAQAKWKEAEARLSEYQKNSQTETQAAAQVASTEKRVQELETALRQSRKENELIAGGRRNFERQVNQLLSEKDAALRAQTQSEERIRSAQEKLAVMQEKYAKLAQIEEELASMTAELDRLRKTNESLAAGQNLVDGVRDELMRQKAENSQLRNRNAELTERLAALEEARKTDSAGLQEAKTLKLNLDEQTAENDRLKKRIGDLSTAELRMNRLQEEALTLREENGQLKKAVEAAQAESERARQQIKNGIDEAQSKVREIEQRNSLLTEEMTKAKASRDAFEKAYGDLSARAEARDKEAREIESRLESAQRSIANLESDSSRFKEKLAELDRLKDEKADLEKARIDAEASARSEQERTRAALEDKQALSQRLNELQERFDKQGKELNDLLPQLNELDTQIADLKKSTSEQTRLNETLKSRLRENQSDIQNLRTNFQAYLDSLAQTFEERAK